MVLHFLVKVLEHYVVDVRAEVPDRCVEQLELVLHAQARDFRTCGGVELGAFAAVGHVDLVHILHELGGLPLSDMLAERTAEVVGDVVFPVGERAGAAESGHDGAGLASYAGLDFPAVDGAFPLFQRVAHFYDGHPEGRPAFHELVCGENAARTGTDYDYVILVVVCIGHSMSTVLFFEFIFNYANMFP